MQHPPTTPDQGKSHLSSFGKKFFHLIEFDKDEQLLLEIRKHPIGLFFILVTGFFVALAVFILAVIVVNLDILESVGFAGAEAIVVFIGFILSLVVLLVTFINVILYRNNVVFITNEKIAQVLYITIFHRKISQLNIGDAQDVTVVQKTFLSRVFKFGTLVIETTGEQQNFTFTYVPDPYQVSKVIIGSHEANLKDYGN